VHAPVTEDNELSSSNFLDDRNRITPHSMLTLVQNS